MKHTKRLLSTILIGIFLCICFAFTGCTPKLEGTYKFKSLSYEQEGVSVNIEVGEKYMGMITLSEDYVVVTLNEDGSANMKSAESEALTGTWDKTENNKIDLTFEGEALSCECDGETLIIEQEGVKLILEKK